MDWKRARLLYKLISRNQHLQEKRHPMFEKNKAMKIMGYFFVAFWAVYMLMFGVIMFFGFDGGQIEAFDMIDGGIIFFFVLDFFFRFPMQETPAQNIKQYKLLNIPTTFLLNTFLLRVGTHIFNLFWAFFFVPFGLLAVPRFYGVVGLAGFLVGWWLLFVINSYWYLFWRTLMNRNVVTIVIPIILYAAVIYFGYFFSDDSDLLFQCSAKLMRGFIQWNPVCFLIFLAVAVPLFFINRKLQRAAIYVELSKTEVVKHVKTNNMVYLDRFGTIGEYLKLELKSTMRNLVMRKQFLSGSVLMLLLCSLFAFTDVYDGSFMRIFVFVYCFSVFGIMTLTNVMCAEGNYIDGLMVRHETVYQLLKAKYYFNCGMFIFPLLFSIMPIAQGKMPVTTALACMLFTSGVVFPFIFQLAAYNNTTMHLNEKLTKAGNNTKVQIIVSMLAMFVPMLIMYVLVQIFQESTASIIMIVIGVVGTVLHPVWLRNIYNRFMADRYKIMDGFRNSR